MVYIVYDYTFVGRKVAFYLIYQLSEFVEWQRLIGILYQQIFQYVF